MGAARVKLSDGTELPYPSLDGNGLARDPHRERCEVSWRELAEQLPLPKVLQVQEGAAAAELAHLISGCTLPQDVAAELTRPLVD